MAARPCQGLSWWVGNGVLTAGKRAFQGRVENSGTALVTTSQPGSGQAAIRHGVCATRTGWDPGQLQATLHLATEERKGEGLAQGHAAGER